MSKRLVRVATAGIAGGYAVSVVVLSYLNAGELRTAVTSVPLPGEAARHALGDIALGSSAALLAAALVSLRSRNRRRTQRPHRG